MMKSLSTGLFGPSGPTKNTFPLAPIGPTDNMKWAWKCLFMLQAIEHYWREFQERENQSAGQDFTLEIGASPPADTGAFDQAAWEDWFRRATTLASSSRAVCYQRQEDAYQDLQAVLQRKNGAEARPLPLYPKGKYSALFLDRDGVINVDRGYIHKREQWEWCRGVFDLVDWGKCHYDRLIVLTNQSGISLGMYQEDEVHRLHQWADGQLRCRQLAIDAWYFCPFHPEGKRSAYRRASLMRKPHPGLALWAREEWDLDLSRCLMVGDKKSDRLEGLGVQTLFVRGNYDLTDESPVFADHHKLLNFLALTNPGLT